MNILKKIQKKFTDTLHKPDSKEHKLADLELRRYNIDRIKSRNLGNKELVNGLAQLEKALEEERRFLGN